MSLVQDARSGGGSGAWQRVYATAHTRFWEWRLGVDTTIDLTRAEGLAGPGVPHAPVSYRALFDLLGRLPMTPDSHLLDVECGSGRALLAARALGMRHVTGLEARRDLAEAARNNLSQARHLLPADATIFVVDAQDYVIPPDVDLVLVSGPSTGQIVEPVIDRIEMSIRETPRPLSMLVLGDGAVRPHGAGADWLRLRGEGVVESHTSRPVGWGLYQAEP